jgi:hypothetical protein
MARPGRYRGRCGNLKAADGVYVISGNPRNISSAYGIWMAHFRHVWDLLSLENSAPCPRSPPPAQRAAKLGHSPASPDRGRRAEQRHPVTATWPPPPAVFSEVRPRTPPVILLVSTRPSDARHWGPRSPGVALQQLSATYPRWTYPRDRPAGRTRLTAGYVSGPLRRRRDDSSTLTNGTSAVARLLRCGFFSFPPFGRPSRVERAFRCP